MFLYPNDTNTISIDINILSKNNSKDDILIKRDNTLIEPINAPSISLNICDVLLSIIATDTNNIKSSIKLRSNIKSTYIFILSPIKV